MLKNRRGRVGTIEIAVFAVFAIAGTAIWFFGFRTAKKPNVILISIDTLRADHVSSYGYSPPTGEKTTPNLDTLALRGVRFSEAHSTTSWTLPAHMALMTGLPDQLHGVRHDQIGLDSHRKMLAERLTGAGYLSVGFFGGPYLHRTYGFNRGFSRYESFDETSSIWDKTGSPNLRDVHEAEFQSHQVVTAEKLTRKAVDFLEHGRDPDKPFFLFIHEWDCHFDYLAPKRIVDRFAPNYHGTISMHDFMSNDAINKDMTPADYQWVIANYDAEINWVDENIGTIFKKLEDLGLAEDTIIVVTADHGEEFFEHGSKGHRNNLNRESLHIPLIIAGPGVRERVNIDQTVRIFDIAPTICDLVGVEWRGVEMYGESLEPFIAGGRVPGALRDLPIIAELTLIPAIADPNDPKKMVDPEFYYHHEAWSSLEHKLIEIRKKPFDKSRPLDLDGKTIKKYHSQLFEIGDPDDPLERTDLSKQNPDVLDRIRERGELFRDSLGRLRALMPTETNPKPPQVDAETLRHLQENGYMADGKKPPPPPKEPESDPDETDVRSPVPTPAAKDPKAGAPKSGGK